MTGSGARAALGRPVEVAGAPPGAVALVAAVAVATVAMLVVGPNPLLAVVPVVAATIAYLAWTRPLRETLYAVTALAIIADVMPWAPTSQYGIWASPVMPLNWLLLENLNKLLGIDALRVAGLEALIVAMLALAALRALSVHRLDRGKDVVGIAPLNAALALSLVAVVAMELWGIARGGDVRQSLWQFRQLFWLPAVATVCTYALRRPRDFVVLAHVLTWTAGVKVAIGLVYYVLVIHAGFPRPPMVTSHADTVLFVIVIAIWISAAFHRPTLGRMLGAAAVCSWTFVGIVINNRRTAYVSLAAALLMLFVLLPSHTRRRYMRIGMYLLPVVLLYLAAGTRKKTGIFAPAASLVSVVLQNDASSGTRDIENYNLIVTLKQHMLLGSGWGHPYSEVSKAYDISELFPQYRYIAHNSILWLAGIGGFVGFTALWLPLGLGVFFSARSYPRARTADERILAYAALTAFTLVVLQAWADMGTQSWTSVLVLGCAYAASARLATATGAWPAGVPLVGRSAVAAGSA